MTEGHAEFKESSHKYLALLLPPAIKLREGEEPPQTVEILLFVFLTQRE